MSVFVDRRVHFFYCLSPISHPPWQYEHEAQASESFFSRCNDTSAKRKRVTGKSTRLRFVLVWGPLTLVPRCHGRMVLHERPQALLEAEH